MDGTITLQTETREPDEAVIQLSPDGKAVPGSVLEALQLEHAVKFFW